MREREREDSIKFTFFSSLDMPNLDVNPFDWSKDVTDVKLHSSQHIQAIPPVHQATLSIIGQWMETYQEDFRYIPQLQVKEEEEGEIRREERRGER